MAALLVAARADPYMENSDCLEIPLSDKEEEEESDTDSVIIDEEDDNSLRDAETWAELREAGLSPMDMAAGNVRVRWTFILELIWLRNTLPPTITAISDTACHHQ